MDEAGSRHYPEKPARVYLFGTCLIDLFCNAVGAMPVKHNRSLARDIFSGIIPDVGKAVREQRLFQML